MAALLLRVAALAAPVPTFLVDIGIGACAGAVGAFAVYPIDYTKTLLQTKDGARFGGFAGAAGAILRDGGPVGFYRGCGVQLLGVAPEKTIKLTVNDAMRGALTQAMGGGALPVAGEILAGMTAGACQVVVTNPLEVCQWPFARFIGLPMCKAVLSSHPFIVL